MFRIAAGAVLLALAMGRPSPAQLPAELQTIDLERPEPRQFVADHADLIAAEDEAQIQQIADSLLTDMAVPIIVVTINAMADHGGAGMRIETFAHFLFDQWEIGHVRLSDQEYWNRGILLLVSKNDRRARIQYGAGWDEVPNANRMAQDIMDNQIIPRFKKGDFSAGIVAGVTALDAMARGEPQPRKPLEWWQGALLAGGAALLIFTVISLIRSGTGGWGWLLWAAVFSVLGFLLYQFLTSSSRHGGGSFGGGGFSGGSFGGGFSGGGGATGSW